MKTTLLLIALCLNAMYHAQDFKNCKSTQDSVLVMKSTIESAGEGRLSYFYEEFLYKVRKNPTEFNKEIYLFVENRFKTKKRTKQ